MYAMVEPSEVQAGNPELAITITSASALQE